MTDDLNLGTVELVPYNWLLNRTRRALLAVLDDRWEQLDRDELWELVRALDEKLDDGLRVVFTSVEENQQ